jgi:hypothetical protein
MLDAEHCYIGGGVGAAGLLRSSTTTTTTTPTSPMTDGRWRPQPLCFLSSPSHYHHLRHTLTPNAVRASRFDTESAHTSIS